MLGGFKWHSNVARLQEGPLNLALPRVPLLCLGDSREPSHPLHPLAHTHPHTPLSTPPPPGSLLLTPRLRELA